MATSIAEQEILEGNLSEPEDCSNKLADLLSSAANNRDSTKLRKLEEAQSILMKCDSIVLDNFLDEILAFKSDRSPEIRKFMISFMQEASSIDRTLLKAFLPCLALFLNDSDSGVIKRAILCHGHFYRLCLSWICKMKVVEENVQIIWNTVVTMKDKIFRMLESPNQGIRTHVIKFMENVAIALAPKTTESECSPRGTIEISLELIPENHSYLRFNDLKLEGSKIIQVFLTLVSSPQVSSSNLMVALACLTAIALQRPIYMKPVIQAFESVHANLPPTLAMSQVSSVRKHLRLQLSVLANHIVAAEFVGEITSLLTDLGATQVEIHKILPKNIKEAAQKIKRQKEDQDIFKPVVKKTRIEDEFINVDQNKRAAAIKITTEYLASRLEPENVTRLVLSSMNNLPDLMPAHFQSSYTPIESAGTRPQIEHLARLMATQMTAVNVGIGVETIAKEEQMRLEKERSAVKVAVEEAALDQNQLPPVNEAVVSSNLVDTLTLESKKTLFSEDIQTSFGHGGEFMRRKLTNFDLRQPPSRPSSEKLDDLARGCFKRILLADKKAAFGGIENERVKVISYLASKYGGSYHGDLQAYILDNIHERINIVFSWLYKEYVKVQCYPVNSPQRREHMKDYDRVLLVILTQLLENAGTDENLLVRIFLEAPMLTDASFLALSRFCTKRGSFELCISTLFEVINKRPSHQDTALNYLLLLTTLDKHEARSQALKFIIQMYSKDRFRKEIETFATEKLSYVIQPYPMPDILTKQGQTYHFWTDDAIKQCLFLYLGLLPLKNELIFELGNVYCQCESDVKRTILRAIEAPVKIMGMQSTALMNFLENCDRGSETLITRMLHILTAQKAPTKELVGRVRDLYNKRVSDIRFLIPVIQGLDKSEIIKALPKFLKLSNDIIKEVLKRILINIDGAPKFTPSELLVALHQIDSSSDLKNAMKAISLCFNESHVFTEQVLAITLNNLLEVTPIPTLLMRTVIQSLQRFPKMKKFVLHTVLQRLIVKKVWKQPRVWEGFIRCCNNTMFESFNVLIQLPAAQLVNVCETHSELRIGLRLHLDTLSPNERNQLPASVVNALTADYSSRSASVRRSMSVRRSTRRSTSVRRSHSKRSSRRRSPSRHKMLPPASPPPPPPQEPPKKTRRISGESNISSDSGLNNQVGRSSTPIQDEQKPILKKISMSNESFKASTESLANQFIDEIVVSLATDISAQALLENREFSNEDAISIMDQIIEDFCIAQAYCIALEAFDKSDSKENIKREIT